MPDSEAGFSVMEALVAMTVLAVTAAGFIEAAHQSVRQTDQVTDRTLARWVGEDALAQLRAGQEAAPGLTEAWGRRFRLSVSRAPSEVPALDRVRVQVTAEASQAQVSLDAYQPTQGDKR
jgi:general secretion pathway protein I